MSGSECKLVLYVSETKINWPVMVRMELKQRCLRLVFFFITDSVFFPLFMS